MPIKRRKDKYCFLVRRRVSWNNEDMKTPSADSVQKILKKSAAYVCSTKRTVSGVTPKWTFRVKSTRTSFHQNELYLQAMIGSLRRSLRDRFLCSSTVLLSLLFNNPLLSRTLSTLRPRRNRPASTVSIDGNYVVIASDLLSSLIACAIVSRIT